MANKPTMTMDIDKNAYSLIAKAVIELMSLGRVQQAIQLSEDLDKAHSYDGVLRRIMKYVDLIPNTPFCAELNRLIAEFKKKK